MRTLKSRHLIIFSIFILFFLVPIGWARPPSEIKLDYDKDKKILHIDVMHVSSDLPDHRIRKMVVYKNELALRTFYYANQRATGILQDVDLDLQPGDTVKVLAICSEAGQKEETMTIPKEEAEKKNETASTDDKSKKLKEEKEKKPIVSPDSKTKPMY